MVAVAFIAGCVLILMVMVILSACVIAGRQSRNDEARAEMLRRGGWK